MSCLTAVFSVSHLRRHGIAKGNGDKNSWRPAEHRSEFWRLTMHGSTLEQKKIKTCYVCQNNGSIYYVLHVLLIFFCNKWNKLKISFDILIPESD